MASMRRVLLGESYGLTKLVRVRVPVTRIDDTADSTRGVNNGDADLMGNAAHPVSAFTNISLSRIRSDIESKVGRC